MMRRVTSHPNLKFSWHKLNTVSGFPLISIVNLLRNTTLKLKDPQHLSSKIVFF